MRPKKIVLDFQKGKTFGPLQNDFKSSEMQEGKKDFAGELSVTLVDARKLSYIFYGGCYYIFYVLNLNTSFIMIFFFYRKNRSIR